MIGKKPLFVARQHGHSLVTMSRSYAARLEGALESDTGLIRTAIEGAVPEEEEQLSGGEGGIARGRATASKNRSAIFVEPTVGTVKIKKLLERSNDAVPSRPLNSPDFAVDLAIAGYH